MYLATSYILFKFTSNLGILVLYAWHKTLVIILCSLTKTDTILIYFRFYYYNASVYIFANKTADKPLISNTHLSVSYIINFTE